MMNFKKIRFLHNVFCRGGNDTFNFISIKYNSYLVNAVDL